MGARFQQRGRETKSVTATIRRPYDKKAGPVARSRPSCACGRYRDLVTIVIRLVGSFDRHPNVIRLAGRKRGELHSDLLQVQTGHFLIELLRKRLDVNLVDVLVLPQVDLRQRLV